MHKDVVEFIKENIDLIDTEDWVTLFRKTINPHDFTLTDDAVKDLVHILDTVGLDTTEARQKVLIDDLNSVAKYLSTSKDMELSDFLRTYMFNLLGFTLSEVIDIIKTNPESKIVVEETDSGIFARCKI